MRSQEYIRWDEIALPTGSHHPVAPTFIENIKGGKFQFEIVLELFLASLAVAHPLESIIYLPGRDGRVFPKMSQHGFDDLAGGCMIPVSYTHL